MAFLPATKKEIKKLGWGQVDFVLVTGDAYVDHPSFGTALIGRLLERYGYKVAVLPQPEWKTAEDFKKFGRPRLGFLINSGTIDSMVAHFSVFKKRRKKDNCTPDGEPGKRPDRALIVYSNRAREAYKGVPVIIGGLEASLRRLGHYDYWDDSVRRSVLLDSKADILIYGMGERTVLEIAEALDSGINVRDITWIKGTCVRTKEGPSDEDTLILPSYEEIKNHRDKYCKSFVMQYRNNDSISGKRLAEKYDEKTWILQNPPAAVLEREELDDIYDMHFERQAHPIYEGKEIPALGEIKFSITSNRGCFGGCSFCALTFHQGRQVRSRSEGSLLREAVLLSERKDFKGYIHDVGGPTANFRNESCEKQRKHGMCMEKECLFPEICPSLKVDHKEYKELLKKMRSIKGIKKVFIRSGIRYDYVMADKDKSFLREICLHHISGTLKVAPEHISPGVLSYMRKPSVEVFEKFAAEYRDINKKLGKKQYLIPYFISSHPGCDLNDAVTLARYLKRTGFVPDQVQDFYPSPGTLSTCMYYTEKDPFSMTKIYVAKSIKEKKLQRALLHFNKKENRALVKEALDMTGRKI